METDDHDPVVNVFYDDQGNASRQVQSATIEIGQDTRVAHDRYQGRENVRWVDVCYTPDRGHRESVQHPIAATKDRSNARSRP